MLPTIMIALNCVLGLILAAGGAYLLVLGGSPYYLIAGIALIATAFLILKRNAAALWVYGLLLLGSLAWAIFEVGLDW